MSQDGDIPRPTDSRHDVANEEFLFHLYRGAELLQDNRVHEAKEELETALDLQPRDPKGQDLLAGVYFRLGMYPRAIQIYEQLHRDIPNDPALMINLALCYLKTGQSQAARGVLEELVVQLPEHRRAWGYLGLAYERLGDLDKAEQAFERAGHASMARRVAAQRAQQPPQQATVAPPQEATRFEDAAIRATAAVAFQELDSGELSFALAEPAMQRTDAGTWRAIELGAAVRSPSVPPPQSLGGAAQQPAASMAPRAPRTLAEVVSGSVLGVSEGGPRFRLHSSGVLVVNAPQGFAARLEALRAHTGGLETAILERQTRTPSPEPFGGLGSPMLRMQVSGPVLLGPRPAHRLMPISLDADSTLFLREDMVFAFDLALTFENGRLTFAEGDALPVAQFRGGGALVLELLDPLVALEVTAGRSVVARRESLIGWTGRLLPRAVPMSEAPSGQRGLLGFSGEGSVLVAGR
ncbi:MAG TPA: tetratricopeptide repeat protein [Polyangiaceae bacterium]|nr:tetratricopeptide repeat protein [Polyangiaceae bacterium]